MLDCDIIRIERISYFAGGMIISDEIRGFLLSSGADLVGFANLQDISSDARDSLPFGVSIAVALNPHIISKIKDGPTGDYYKEYERANRLLDKLGYLAVHFFEKYGHKAKWLAATGVGYDPETLSAPLPHKTTATLAGLGWIGKCALLVTATFGSAVRLTTVLTDAKLPTGRLIKTPYCGKCTACVDVCPGHAPSGMSWQVGLHRDLFFDPFACRETALKLASRRAGIQKIICGICIAVCPWTLKYIKRNI